MDSDLIEDAAWVSWMQYNEWDPEIVRSEVVNYYIDLTSRAKARAIG